jgi:hypothetical protein
MRRILALVVVRSQRVLLIAAFFGLSAAACSQNDLPPPAICQQPLELMTPWWGLSGASDSCSSPFAALHWLRSRAGSVYYGAGSSLCVVDAQGIRSVGSTVKSGGSWGFVEAFWIDGDRLLYTDGYAIYAVPIDGGERATLASFTVDDLPFGGAYAYDGTFIYWGSGVGDPAIFRMPVAGGTPEKLVSPSGETVGALAIAGDRLDFTPSLVSGETGPLTRMTLTGGVAAKLDLSLEGALLASTGHLTYVRYARSPVPAGEYDDGFYDLGVIGAHGKVTSAWTGDVPQLMPSTASVHANTLYVGGRIHYSGGAVFIGVTALPIGATTGDVLGCSKTDLSPGKAWADVFATTADDDFVYALISRTAPGRTEYAIARFPHG